MDLIDEEDDIPLSEDEENYLDMLLSNEILDEEGENDENFVLTGSQLTTGSSSQSTCDSQVQDELTSQIYWRDQSDLDDGLKDPRLFTFKPERPPGLQLGLLTRQAVQVLRKPLDFFLLFLTHEIVLQMCIATNHHARAQIALGKNKSYAGNNGAWIDVTVEEMYRFVGILVYKSVVHLQTLERYWLTNPLYRCTIIANTMTFLRFKAILSLLQINSDADKDDKLTRVRLLLDHVAATSKKTISAV